MKFEIFFAKYFYSTFTGKLETINKNRISHIVPIWYTSDEEDNIIFNTGNNQ
jgi:hypothetical protein